ncbi:hypothetical protein [Nocardioides montaniterrae]
MPSKSTSKPANEPVRLDVDAAEFGADVAAAAESAPELATRLDAIDGTPEPDEFGRYRVRDEDTGHELSVHAAALPHGNYTVLDELASDPVTSDPLPVKHHESLSSHPASGQLADPEKENANG